MIEESVIFIADLLCSLRTHATINTFRLGVTYVTVFPICHSLSL